MARIRSADSIPLRSTMDQWTGVSSVVHKPREPFPRLFLLRIKFVLLYDVINPISSIKIIRIFSDNKEIFAETPLELQIIIIFCS